MERGFTTGNLIAIRQLMIENGDAELRIWATEYGLPTGGAQAVTPEHQADYVADFLATWDDFSYTGPAFIYTTVDRGDGTEAGSFGIFDANWNEKPVADVIRAAIAGEDYEDFIEEAAEDLQEQLADAVAQAYADAVAQAYADAVAQAYADALAKALADARAAALAAAFGVVAPPAVTTLVAADETQVVAPEGTKTVEVPAQGDVTAVVKATDRAQTSTVVVQSASTADEAAAKDANSGDLQPADQPARHPVGSGKPSNGNVENRSDNGSDANRGAAGTTGGGKRGLTSVTNGMPDNDRRANDDTEAGKSDAAGTTGGPAAA